DNDTNPDIILFSTGENKIIVYRNTDPTTLAFEEHVVDAGALGVSAVRVTDYDNDSDLDLIASLKNASEIILYELVDPQTWVFAKHTLSSSIIQPSDIQASDIDNDNDIDCVIASPLVSTLYVLRSGSPGDLSPSLEIVTASSQFAQAIAVKDLDDDGLPEIVAGNIYLDIYWPDNTASTYTKETIASGIIGVKKILVSNVNTDNTEDIVALVPNQTYIKWFENHTHVGEGWKSKQQSFPSSKAFDADIIDSNDDAVREILSINVSGSSLIYSVESDSTRQVRAMNGSRISSGATLPLTLPVTLDDATVEAPEIHFKASARLSGLLLGDVLTSNFLRLTGPTTIDGDLTILPGGVVDLNGHTLTVTGTTTPPITTRSKSATNSPCPTDLNLDNTIDGADLGLVLSSWGQPGISDLNSDGTTDGSDLGLLLSSWGRCAGAR
ncbi:MAG: FG-GAP repeat domain-containing protein, partial [Phycisphaerales bacterium JB043]